MANETVDGSNALIIIGMHRSGTSLVASMLHSAGLDVGKQLMSAHESINAKGFYENLDFVRFHEQVLESLGESRFGWTTKINLRVPETQAPLVDDLLARNSSDGAWGWKDPRTTLFLQYWSERLPKANFIFVHRPPWEVIDSLYRRGDQEFQSSPRLAVDIWTSYNRAILNFMDRNSDRGLLTGLQSIVDNPAMFIERANERFKLELKKPANDIFDEKLIERSSSKTNQAVVIQKFFPECRDTYAELLRRSDPIGGRKIELDDATISDAELGDVFLNEWASARNAQRELKNGSKTLYDVRSQLFHTNEKLQALERSRFWKLRNIVHRLKRT
jgi:hypothetical protein